MTARLERLARSLEEGLARMGRLGGCHVCRSWPAWWDGYAADDPWAACGGCCPVCRRRPDLLFAATEEQAALLAAQWSASSGDGRAPKVYVGIRASEI